MVRVLDKDFKLEHTSRASLHEKGTELPLGLVLRDRLMTNCLIASIRIFNAR
jgi:hypothetical protein